MAELLIKNVRAADENSDRICDVLIDGGKIVRAEKDISETADRVIDVQGVGGGNSGAV